MTERLRLVREFVSTTTHRPMRIEIIPALPNEASIGVIHVARDLSEERAMRTRLVAADRLATIGRLAAGVAHEINNPAAFVTVNLGVLKERFETGAASTPEALAILEESLNGMHRIREIVRDLKGFARERSRDRVDLSQVALTAIRMSTHETRGRARVERALGENVLAEVRGARIAQVILNLIVNAAQAIPPNSPQDHCIRVRTYRDGDRTRVEVADTGPGVPQDLRSRIFEPFFTTREATGGTGLGLWLSRGIVEEEGGTLEVREATGGGACFVIDLPAARPLVAQRVME
jgi:signal transduction histidine kinase